MSPLVLQHPWHSCFPHLPQFSDRLDHPSRTCKTGGTLNNENSNTFRIVVFCRRQSRSAEDIKGYNPTQKTDQFIGDRKKNLKHVHSCGKKFEICRLSEDQLAAELPVLFAVPFGCASAQLTCYWTLLRKELRVRASFTLINPVNRLVYPLGGSLLALVVAPGKLTRTTALFSGAAILSTKTYKPESAYARTNASSWSSVWQSAPGNSSTSRNSSNAFCAKISLKQVCFL